MSHVHEVDVLDACCALDCIGAEDFILHSGMVLAEIWRHCNEMLKLP